jgi:hypothetical protein
MATPSGRKAFRQLLNSSPGIDDLPAMEQEFYLASSARAAVLLQASLVEDTLRRMIQAKFMAGASADVVIRVFEANGPLSTFSNKIIMGHALGLYGNIFRHDLDIIRELRNGFAHTRRPLEFETKEVTDMCNYLRLPDSKMSQQPPIYSERYPITVATDNNHPRTRFTAVCYTITVHLMMSQEQLLSGTIYELP